MSNEPTDTNPVDVNTDDLEAFTTLFNGKTSEVKEESKEDVKADVDPADETEKTEEVAKDDPEDTPEEEVEEEKPEEKPKKVNRFQERINELTAKAREAERALEAVRTELAEKQKTEDQKPAPKTEAVKLPDPNSKNEDGSEKYPLGEFDPAYIRDLNRAIIEEESKAFKEREEKDRSERQIKEARDELQQQWVEKLAPVTEQHDDFVEKTIQLESTFDGLPADYSDYLVQTIKSLDHGPEVLYYFANNLDEAKKVVQSGPLGATLALGELNAMFKGQSRKETKVSKAPVPPQVSTKGTSVRKSVALDTDDLDAFSDVFFPKKGK
jgi:hypothetical protein